MFSKIKIIVMTIFFMFFQDTQGSCQSKYQKKYTRQQLENYIGKSVFNFQIVEFGTDRVEEDWMYTTELSKILLISDRSLFSLKIRTGLFAFTDLFFDSRFETFIQNVGKVSQHELQETIKDAILLAPFNKRSYTANKLLNYLIQLLQNKIVIIKDQIKYDSMYEERSLESMKKSVPFAVLLIALVAFKDKYCLSNNKDKTEELSGAELLSELATILFLPASYKAGKDFYNVMTIDHTTYTKHLDEFEALLAFVEDLKAELETKGALSFNLVSGYVGTIKVHDGYLGQYQTVVFE